MKEIRMQGKYISCNNFSPWVVKVESIIKYLELIWESSLNFVFDIERI